MQFVTIATEAEVCQVGKQVGAASLRFHITRLSRKTSQQRARVAHLTVTASTVRQPNFPVALLPPYRPILSPSLLILTMFSAEYSSPNSSPAPSSVAIGKLPPLPKIRSGRIRKRVFTHCSLAGENKYDFQAPESDPSTDNEE